MDPNTPPTSELPQIDHGREVANPGLTAQAAPLLLNGAYALFAIYLAVVVFDLLPVRLLDPLWIITAAGTLANAVSLPIGGLVFAHLAGALAPMEARIHQRRRLLSRLAAWAALGFLLLLPALCWATWRGVTNVQRGSLQQALLIERKAKEIDRAIDVASSPAELRLQMVRLQGPQLSDQDLQQPLPQLKRALRQLVSNARNNLLAQLPKPNQEGYFAVYKQAVRSAVLSLLSALAFAALSYDQLKNKTILQSLVKPRAEQAAKPKGFIASLRKFFAPLYRSFVSFFAPDPRKRFWAQVKDREKRSSAVRAREAKRQAANVRRLQRERERKWQKDERQRQREEQRKRQNESDD